MSTALTRDFSATAGLDPFATAAIPRCLVVDDEPRLRQILVRVMRADGFIVDEASNGFEAIAQCSYARGIGCQILLREFGAPEREAMRRAFKRGDVPFERFAGRILSPSVLVAAMHAKLFMDVRAREIQGRHDRAADCVRTLSGVNRARGRTVAQVGIEDTGHQSRESVERNRNGGTDASHDGPWDAA